MSTSCRSERSLISHEEYEIVKVTHHPAIYELKREDLVAARRQLNTLRDKERTLARQTRRTVRGKADERGKSFPGTAERPARRKQVFASAIKRVNREIARLDAIDARAAHAEAAKKALALVRAANFPDRPAAGPTAGEGMRANESTRRRRIVSGSKVGSVSQAGKRAQAGRDGR